MRTAGSAPCGQAPGRCGGPPSPSGPLSRCRLLSHLTPPHLTHPRGGGRAYRGSATAATGTLVRRVPPTGRGTLTAEMMACPVAHGYDPLAPATLIDPYPE